MSDVSKSERKRLENRIRTADLQLENRDKALVAAMARVDRAETAINFLLNVLRVGKDKCLEFTQDDTEPKDDTDQVRYASYKRAATEILNAMNEAADLRNMEDDVQESIVENVKDDEILPEDEDMLAGPPESPEEIVEVDTAADDESVPATSTDA